MASNDTLIQFLIAHADARPDEVALRSRRDGGRQGELTWQELSMSAQGVARRLCADFADHTIVVALHNCAEAHIVLLGAMWSGATTFVLSPSAPVREFHRQIEKLGKCLLIARQDLAESLEGAFDHTLDVVSATTIASDSGERVPDHSLRSSILLHSSGTTGRPKIARREMSSLVALGRNLSQAMNLRDSDRMLLTVPLCHSYGIDTALAAAVVAGSEILVHERFSPTSVRQALADCAITVWPAVPLMFDAISRNLAPGSPHSLRLAVSAGSPLPARIHDRFVRAFEMPIGQIYGASEFGSVFFNSPEASPFDPAAAGRPLRGVEARVLDPGDPGIDKPLAPGTVGEIAIRTPTMLSEYLDSEAGPDPEGFLRTGDLGYLDSTGVLRLTGRIKLLIDVGAQKVNPLEVEDVLCQHPAVAEAVVVGVPYSDTASRLKAVILPRDGQAIDPGDLRTYLKDQLIAYKVPRYIEVRSSLPRSSTGKILRQDL